MSNDTQPEIRFPGFTDDWEQRKLGDFVVDYVEKTSVQNQFPMLTSSQQKGIVLQEDYFANRQVTTENNIGYFVLPRGYFTFRSRSDNDVFVFNRNDIIDRGIISYFYPVFTLKSADSDFFLRRINNGIQRQLSIQAEGTGQHVLSLKKFKNIVAMFPSEEEQQKIGTFFKQLDDTIALHQRKLDLLKETKKGFLQKMFPENGAKVPEIRFPGFTEDWEERKLGDITKISTGKLDANAMVENGKYDFYTSGIKKYRIDVAAFEGPSITIAGNGATVGYMHLADNKFNAYQRTYVLQEFLVDRSFIFSEIGNKLPKKIKQEARTGNIPYIVMDMLTELKLSIPQNNSEQQKIGNFFKQLDDTITLHQRKLDLLKEMKKGFLQKMFV
ncbi:restriction endonuclease subunit S [Enterococcus faecium]|uniref:restriction endonuclease subunit S n=1 Tax=Enterococcus faecium TaxID=1352 RepID=UPI002953360B|nr:restriction endonuclease subunit S [Enterococcus faecium]MDV7718165.1 restriction endonuclease subunit S [Enterococcus faecium]